MQSRARSLAFRDSEDQLMFGFRVAITGEPEEPAEPAFVALAPIESGISATVVPNTGGGGWMVYGNTRVVDHGHGFSIHVHAKHWDGQP